MEIKPEIKLSDLLREYPQSKNILLRYGICDCCGGNLTLKDHAKQRNIDIDTLLKEIEESIL